MAIKQGINKWINETGFNAQKKKKKNLYCNFIIFIELVTSIEFHAIKKNIIKKLSVVNQLALNQEFNQLTLIQCPWIKKKLINSKWPIKLIK